MELGDVDVRWIDVPCPVSFVSVTIPPRVSLAVPEAHSPVMPCYSTLDQLRGHLFIDHLVVATYNWKLHDLLHWHSVDHSHPYWSHYPRSGVIIHEHAAPLPASTELDEWTW